MEEGKYPQKAPQSTKSLKNLYILVTNWVFKQSCVHQRNLNKGIWTNRLKSRDASQQKTRPMMTDSRGGGGGGGGWLDRQTLERILDYGQAGRYERTKATPLCRANLVVRGWVNPVYWIPRCTWKFHITFKEKNSHGGGDFALKQHKDQSNILSKAVVDFPWLIWSPEAEYRTEKSVNDSIGLAQSLMRDLNSSLPQAYKAVAHFKRILEQY